VNIELPFDDVGDDLDELVARIDGVLDEQFLSEVDAALERLQAKDGVELVVETLAS
jgi:hypothetical protein